MHKSKHQPHNQFCTAVQTRTLGECRPPLRWIQFRSRDELRIWMISKH